MVHRFLLRVRLLAARHLRPLDVLHVDRHFDFHDVDAVAILRELLHGADDDLRLFLRVLEPLLVGALFVADELEEERDVVCAALVADSLDPGVLVIVNRLRLERRVVEQDFQAVGSRFLQPAH